MFSSQDCSAESSTMTMSPSMIIFTLFMKLSNSCFLRKAAQQKCLQWSLPTSMCLCFYNVSHLDKHGKLNPYNSIYRGNWNRPFLVYGLLVWFMTLERIAVDYFILLLASWWLLRAYFPDVHGIRRRRELGDRGWGVQVILTRAFSGYRPYA